MVIFSHLRSPLSRLIGYNVCTSIFTCFIYVKVNFEKISVIPIEKFPSLKLPMNTIMLQHLIIQFPLHYLSSGCFWRLKTKESFKLLAPKVVSRGGLLREVSNIVI